jgi:hypothetical protein
MARITVDDLWRLMDEGKGRSCSTSGPTRAARSIRAGPGRGVWTSTTSTPLKDLPQEREIILYCLDQTKPQRPVWPAC